MARNGTGGRSAAKTATRWSSLAALSTTALLLGAGGAGCGADAAGPHAQVALRIRIAAAPTRNAPPRTWRLRCQPQGGNWPQGGSACDRLTPALLAPITAESRDLVPIAQRRWQISGSAFGRGVSLDFDHRGSSTRRDRFHDLVEALGGPPR